MRRPRCLAAPSVRATSPRGSVGPPSARSSRSLQALLQPPVRDVKRPRRDVLGVRQLRFHWNTSLRSMSAVRGLTGAVSMRAFTSGLGCNRSAGRAVQVDLVASQGRRRGGHLVLHHPRAGHGLVVGVFDVEGDAVPGLPIRSRFAVDAGPAVAAATSSFRLKPPGYVVWPGARPTFTSGPQSLAMSPASKSTRIMFCTFSRMALKAVIVTDRSFGVSKRNCSSRRSPMPMTFFWSVAVRPARLTRTKFSPGFRRNVRVYIVAQLASASRRP